VLQAGKEYPSFTPRQGNDWPLPPNMEKQMNIFELKEEFKEAQESIEEMVEDGVIDEQTAIDTLSSIECEFKDKCVSKALVYKNLSASISKMLEAEGRMAKRRKGLEKVCEAIKANIKFCMEEVDMNKIDDIHAPIAIRKNGGKAKLWIDDSFDISKYQYEKKTVETVTDEDLIREDIEAGVIKEGAELRRGTHLRIG